MRVLLRCAVFLPLLASAAVGQERPATAAADTGRLPGVEILGRPDVRSRMPGSISILGEQRLLRDRVLSIGEALRKVSGVHVRDEEGVGLRPNIGIRGLNPTRSSKVLLLEDGLPLTIAPYGDNAAYYHPPIERFAGIEVIKGSGQILYGPQTVGGVINYLTPAIPASTTAALRVSGGSQAYGDIRGQIGTSRNGAGFLLDAGRRLSEGARRNTFSTVSDATIKAELPIADDQRVELRTNVYREASQVTYSGLTEAEWAADARQNPFANDRFDVSRFGASVAHAWRASPMHSLRTTAYGYHIDRPWWRQSSNSAQRPNDASDPTCGGMANLRTTCGVEGRLRAYTVLGLESRWSGALMLGAAPLLLDAGVRAHVERQDRRQINGSTPESRSIGAVGNVNSGIVEDNRRTTDAYSAYAQGRVTLGPVLVTPGVRVERIFIGRQNHLPLAAAPGGISGSTSLTEVIPGLGATWSLGTNTTMFAGAHRGFSPPRPEDIISNSTGGVIELLPERSWNYELGLRRDATNGVGVELTAFHMDFENQVVAASIAGGTGAALTNAGRTRHSGLELEAHLAPPTSARWATFSDVALTWVPVAQFTGARFAYVGTAGSDVVGKVYAEQNAAGTRSRQSVTGNRLPYAPELTATLGAGIRHRRGADLRVELVHLGRQFADPLNTTVLVADGQQGVIDAVTLIHAVANLPLPAHAGTLYVSVKNLRNTLYVVDRSRGLLPGMPRQVQVGVRTTF
ncbi:MAG: TonB-dependent receptor [Gemmatimonadaceae bacterium]|nr:TonB-dependent receptor [Gemmatimonadaceae bacterium]